MVTNSKRGMRLDVPLNEVISSVDKKCISSQSSRLYMSPTGWSSWQENLYCRKQNNSTSLAISS